MSGPSTLVQIATRLGGRISSPQDVLIHQVGSLERAGPGQITFLSNPGRRVQLAGTYTGMFPADDNESWARNTAVVRHLAGLMDRVRSLEKRIRDKEKDDG